MRRSLTFANGDVFIDESRERFLDHMTQCRYGKLQRSNGDVYEGHCKLELGYYSISEDALLHEELVEGGVMAYVVADGTGKLTTKIGGVTIHGRWRDGMMEYNETVECELMAAALVEEEELQRIQYENKLERNKRKKKKKKKSAAAADATALEVEAVASARDVPAADAAALEAVASARDEDELALEAVLAQMFEAVALATGNAPAVPAEDTGEPGCVVCMDADRTHAFIPCGHLCVCKGCVDHFNVVDGNGKCPMCKEVVVSIYRIYQ